MAPFITQKEWWRISEWMWEEWHERRAYDQTAYTILGRKNWQRRCIIDLTGMSDSYSNTDRIKFKKMSSWSVKKTFFNVTLSCHDWASATMPLRGTVEGEDCVCSNTSTNKTRMCVSIWTNVFIDRQSVAFKDRQQKKKKTERCSVEK